MAKKKYSFKDKIKYYQARLNDTSLTLGQRHYASNFLDGAGITDPKADSYSVDEIKSKIVETKIAYQDLVSSTLVHPDLISLFRGKHAGELAYWEELLRKRIEYDRRHK